jgi:hypothetical protein
MNEQERKMLEEVVILSRENNAMVHKLVSAQNRATFWKMIYWVIIICALIISYNLLQPYIASITKMYNYTSQVVNSFPKLGGVEN